MPGWWYKEAHRILSIRRTERALIIKAANRRNEMQTWLHGRERDNTCVAGEIPQGIPPAIFYFVRGTSAHDSTI